jgi:hypothetical protein
MAVHFGELTNVCKTHATNKMSQVVKARLNCGENCSKLESFNEQKIIAFKN